MADSEKTVKVDWLELRKKGAEILGRRAYERALGDLPVVTPGWDEADPSVRQAFTQQARSDLEHFVLPALDSSQKRLPGGAVEELALELASETGARSIIDGAGTYEARKIQRAKRLLDAVVPTLYAAWEKEHCANFDSSQETSGEGLDRVREEFFSALEAAGWSDGEEIPTDEVAAALDRAIERVREDEPAPETKGLQLTEEDRDRLREIGDAIDRMGRDHVLVSGQWADDTAFLRRLADYQSTEEGPPGWVPKRLTLHSYALDAQIASAWSEAEPPAGAEGVLSFDFVPAGSPDPIRELGERLAAEIRDEIKSLGSAIGESENDAAGGETPEQSAAGEASAYVLHSVRNRLSGMLERFDGKQRILHSSSLPDPEGGK